MSCDLKSLTPQPVPMPTLGKSIDITLYHQPSNHKMQSELAAPSAGLSVLTQNTLIDKGADGFEPTECAADIHKVELALRKLGHTPRETRGAHWKLLNQ